MYVQITQTYNIAILVEQDLEHSELLECMWFELKTKFQRIFVWKIDNVFSWETGVPCGPGFNSISPQTINKLNNNG
jgi:hypothetical protein